MQAIATITTTYTIPKSNMKQWNNNITDTMKHNKYNNNNACNMNNRTMQTINTIKKTISNNATITK
jgi:hypothetical protein